MMTLSSMTALPERPVCAAMTTSCADLHVVADVHEVVDFCAAADSGFVEGAAVDGGVGADLDIVFNHQTSDLRELLVASGLLVAHVAEAFAAEHGSCLDDDSIAEVRAPVDRHVGVDAAVGSNRRPHRR